MFLDKLKMKKSDEQLAGKEEELEGKTDEKAQKLQEKAESSKKEARMQAEIERLKAISESYKDLGKVRDERLNRVNEEIGELRSMIFDAEKKMSDLEKKALAAVEMVGQVQPEKLMIEVKKQDAKAEAIKNKLEGFHELMSKVMDELKEIRRKTEAFRGVEQIMQLSQEVRHDLEASKIMESKIKKHADKVESIFIKSQKDFDELKTFKQVAIDLKTTFDSAAKQGRVGELKFANIASKSDLAALAKKSESLGSDLAKQEESMKNEIRSDLVKELGQLIESKVNEIHQNTASVSKQVSQLDIRLTNSEEKQKDVSRKVAGWINHFSKKQ